MSEPEEQRRRNVRLALALGAFAVALLLASILFWRMVAQSPG